MRSIAIALAALLFGLLQAAPAGAQEVGVAAAVNQAAKGTRSNDVRTIALGDNVIHNERIDTDGVGLVQILLVDGTTFTVGPNSSLVIDSFVYDPNAGTASVAATLTKGVFRFIGGATSKTEDGVKLNTPVGTVGIRGGVADINLTPQGDVPPHVSLIFGNELLLTQGRELLGRLYQGGYSLAFGANGQVEVIKTPPGWTSQIQQALSGKPGTTGGAGGGPTNQQVANSGVADENSGQGVGANTLDPDVPPLSPQEIETLLLAVATYDELRNEVIHVTPTRRALKGFSSGSAGFEGFEGQEYYAPFFVTSTQETSYGDPEDSLHPIHTEVFVDGSGEPSIGVIDVGIPGCAPGCRIRFESEDGEEVTASTSYVIYDYENETVEFYEAPVDVVSFDIFKKDGVLAEMPGTVVCECKFLEWGGWSATVVYTPPYSTNGSQTGEGRGLWVAGDLTTNDQLTELSSTTASYQGSVVGNVTDYDYYTDTASSYLASGNLDLYWSFGQRSGEMNITDFDGRDFNGDINMAGDSATFSGYLGGPSEGSGALVKGGFANDGSDIGAGVLGDFIAHDGDWDASGIFFGERTP